MHICVVRVHVRFDDQALLYVWVHIYPRVIWIQAVWVQIVSHKAPGQTALLFRRLRVNEQGFIEVKLKTKDVASIGEGNAVALAVALAVNTTDYQRLRQLARRRRGRNRAPKLEQKANSCSFKKTTSSDAVPRLAQIGAKFCLNKQSVPRELCPAKAAPPKSLSKCASALERKMKMRSGVGQYRSVDSSRTSAAVATRAASHVSFLLY